MRIAVCSSGETLDSPVDPRFGRCAYFVSVDTDTMESVAAANPGAMSPQGTGIQAAQVVSSLGVEAVVAGNFGPNAFNVLSAANIKVFPAQAGTVREVAELVKSGQLSDVSSPTVPSHFGMGPGKGGEE